MSHMIICAVCGVKYDRDLIPTVKHGARRYAHQECYPEGELIIPEVKPKAPRKAAVPVKFSEIDDTEEFNKLKDYIQFLFGKENCNWSLIVKQIKTYVTENGYSCSGIAKTLHWFYEVKGNPRDREVFKERGIGIVPYVYASASEFDKKLFMLHERYMTESAADKIKNNIVHCVVINSPRVKDTKKKKFNLDEDGE